MRKISIFELTPGMVLAEDVMNFEHQTILAKGTELTDVLISRIELNGILSVFVEEPGSGSAEIPEDYGPAPQQPRRDVPPPPPGSSAEFAPSNPSYSERIRNSREFKEYKRDFDLATDEFKFKLNDMVENNSAIDTGELLQEPLKLIEKSGSGSNTFDMIHNMRDYDDLTYAHSMNVALLNYVAASWLGWSREDRELAMLCGMLHDIGKLKISHSILTKPGKLDAIEYKHIQKHPIHGYKILNEKGVNEHIQNTALMHHERYDGSGYPLQLSGESIDRFARLTAVTDVYEAMTAARCYRGPLCPFRVIEIFEDEGFEKYDAEFILTFLSNVGATYVRNACLLSDGREGEIIMLNKERLSRPVVQCGYDYVDLMKHPELTIQSLL
ncbi:MAG: HD-GYP domain-containing protein [Lachnospiraceae bacterium]|nr:HD-GYP domain-containing protein [Lachnospiraceae bacterium]